MQAMAGWLTVIVAGLKALGPYAAIELLLPGGSLMALGLWFFQRRLRKGAAVANRGAMMPRHRGGGGETVFRSVEHVRCEGRDRSS
jgi:hypothetical protein